MDINCNGGTRTIPVTTEIIMAHLAGCNIEGFCRALYRFIDEAQNEITQGENGRERLNFGEMKKDIDGLPTTIKDCIMKNVGWMFPQNVN